VGQVDAGMLDRQLVTKATPMGAGPDLGHAEMPDVEA
jgi:hypothetical protein